MHTSKLHYLFGIAILCLSVIPQQAQAATKSKHNSSQSSKERLVLMPLRLGEEDKSRQAAMEIALLEGLQQKYEVFSGEQVAKKAREIFMKESKNTAHKECDETRCLQNIAEAFQAELLAIASVSKQEDGYFLALSIQNIFDNKVVYSKSVPCQSCNAYQVVDKLKEISGVGGNSAADDAQKDAERKLKAEQLKQEQLAFEQKLRDADATERKHLLDAKEQDDKRLAELKAAAELRRSNSTAQVSGVFPTVASAVVEINRLKDRISAIEASYEKELAQTRKQVTQRYATQLAALDKAQRDEFETAADFKAKQDKKRGELHSQRDEELARLNVTTETAPLRDKIKSLSEREYAVSAESLVVELGVYNAEAQQFPVSIRSKIPGVQWSMNGGVLLPVANAKMFKQQWIAGLVRAEAKMKPAAEPTQIELVNDGDNTHHEILTNEKIAFSRISESMVRITGKNYEMSKYEVTQIEWRIVMGTNPSKFTKCGDNCPVEQVSWNDVQEFLQKLNAKTGRQYRLPNVEEWEYACYGGNKTEYCGSNDINSVAWYNQNSNNTTHPVRQKQANGYGLYDMSGNVREWMQNELGSWRAFRGGSWGEHALSFLARSGIDPADRVSLIGFRLARTLP